jgi:hypothetical protein
MCGDRCRGFCTEVFRGLDDSRVANLQDDQRQSLTREAQDFLQSEQFKVGLRHCFRPPGSGHLNQCIQIVEDAE